MSINLVPLRLRRRTAILATAGLTGMVALVAGCQRPAEISAIPPVKTEHSAEEMMPGVIAGERGVLVLAGTEIDVLVKSEKSADRLRIDLVSHGEAIESESYTIGPKGFDLSSGAGHSYQPGLPILKYPLSVGDSWKWKGRLEAGAQRWDALANVSTRAEKINERNLHMEAVRVQVELEIHSEGIRPAKRELNFWFVPGSGLIKREFGQASTRYILPKSKAEEPALP